MGNKAEWPAISLLQVQVDIDITVYRVTFRPYVSAIILYKWNMVQILDQRTDTLQDTIWSIKLPFLESYHIFLML